MDNYNETRHDDTDLATVIASMFPDVTAPPPEAPPPDDLPPESVASAAAAAKLHGHVVRAARRTQADAVEIGRLGNAAFDELGKGLFGRWLTLAGVPTMPRYRAVHARWVRDIAAGLPTAPQVTSTEITVAIPLAWEDVSLVELARKGEPVRTTPDVKVPEPLAFDLDTVEPVHVVRDAVASIVTAASSLDPHDTGSAAGAADAMRQGAAVLASMADSIRPAVRTSQATYDEWIGGARARLDVAAYAAALRDVAVLELDGPGGAATRFAVESATRLTSLVVAVLEHLAVTARHDVLRELAGDMIADVEDVLRRIEPEPTVPCLSDLEDRIAELLA